MFLRTMDLAHAVCECGGRVVLENPCDPGPPYPSFWSTPQYRFLAKRHSWEASSGDQCMLGAVTRKRTTLAGNLEGLHEFAQHRCNHRSHAKLVGWDSAKGVFLTSALSQYPQPLCDFIARRIVSSWLSFGSGLGLTVVRPELWHGLASITSTGRRRNPMPAACRNVFPAGKGVNFLDEPAHTSNSGQVCPGDRPAQ